MDKILNKVIAIYKKHYSDQKEAEAHSGGYGDGGFTSAMTRISDFNEGIEYAKSGQYPSFLEEYTNKAISESDPEWAEYQRLKKKFKESSH